MLGRGSLIIYRLARREEVKQDLYESISRLRDRVPLDGSLVELELAGWAATVRKLLPR